MAALTAAIFIADMAFGSGDLQVACCRTATLGDDFEVDALTFSQRAQSGLLDRTDVHKDVFVARLGLNKAEALLGIEKLNCSCSHVFGLQNTNYCAQIGRRIEQSGCSN